jgi:aminoglycoside phosphotransferase (APT) family kinase protein
MHHAQVETDVALVRRLLAGQFPDLAGLPILPVRSMGTVNTIYRIGDDLCARLPLTAKWAGDLDREMSTLTLLGSRLPLRIPEPVAAGRPGDGYPLNWAIYRWLDGQPYADELIEDEHNAAADLASFVAALRAVPATAGAPRGGRRPLRMLDKATREAIERIDPATLDRAVLHAEWQRALAAPAWDGSGPVWIHTDLLRPNILASQGRIGAVIDFGMAGLGDPAADVIAAWTVFGPAGRAAYRAALAVDDGTWERARGYALHQAVCIVPYYVTSNPGFSALAVRTISQILGDSAAITSGPGHRAIPGRLLRGN